MDIDANKLHREIEAAGITISGCNSNGVVWDNSGKEIQDRAEVKAVLKAHDPTPDPEPTKAQRRAELKTLFAKQKAGTLTAAEETRFLDVLLGMAS